MLLMWWPCQNVHLHLTEISHRHHHHWHDIPLRALAFLTISEQFNFYSLWLSASLPTPNLEDQVIPLQLAPTPRPVRPGWPYQ
jgi:hypothetical protein